MEGFDWKTYLKRSSREQNEGDEGERFWEQIADSPYVCHRRDCRYYNEPHKGAPFSCDYLGMTGKSRIAQIPKEERLDFSCCPCYEHTERSQNGCTEDQYEQKAAYDWQEGRRLYKLGKSDGEIAAALGCARSTVRYWRRRMHLSANSWEKGR